jgi:hypothetical protein
LLLVLVAITKNMRIGSDGRGVRKLFALNILDGTFVDLDPVFVIIDLD